MFLRTVVVILLICCIFSCGRKSSHTTTSNTIQLVDTIIDYRSVDVYPLFSNCESLSDKKAQKECFREAISEKLSDYLVNNEYKVRELVNDSTQVELMINSNGKTKVVSIKSSDQIRTNLPKLDSIINEAVNQLPIIKPALKRGIPIKSQYKLAVIIKTN